MKILLTGVHGFIGSYLAGKWSGVHDLIGIGRHNKLGDVCRRVVYADLADSVTLDEPVDAIVHTAAQSPAENVAANSFIRSNIDSIRNLIRYARKFEVRKFLYLSSISLYGQISRPVLDENTPIVNPDIYGLTKYLGELLLRDEEATLSISLRLPGVLGRGAKTPWLARVAEKLRQGVEVSIYNPGSLFNNIVYLSDLEKFISELLAADLNGFKTVILGCLEPITIRETVWSLKKYLDSKSNIVEKESDKISFTISLDRAIEMGYNPMSTKEILRIYSRECRESLLKTENKVENA